MSVRSLAVGLSVLAGFSALSGCAVAPAESDEATVSVAESAIKGGYADANDTAVVAIVALSAGGIGECTGSLIAPNLILTARHCVADITNLVGGGVDCSKSKFSSPKSASTFYVTTKQFLSQNPDDYHPVKQVIVPTTTTEVCGGDVALLILNENIDPAEAVPLVARVDTQIKKDDQYSAVGFGGTQDNGTGSGQRRRLDDLFVNCVGKQCSALYISITHEWQGDHGICQGDSGGPALDLQNRVIGVTSRGGAGCTYPVYGDVFPWGEWLKENAAHAADLGGYPLPPWATGMTTDPAFYSPIGDACTDPSACASGACLGDGVTGYCTRPCSDAGPCPEGYTCGLVGDQQFCQKPVDDPGPGTGGEGTTATGPGTTGAGGNGSTPSEESGCSVGGDDPTKPVPWSTGVGIAAAGLALLRRRRRGTTVGR